MDFHGQKVDVDRAISNICMEYAKRELDDYMTQQENKNESVTCQKKLDVMFDAYFISYGHLLNHSEQYIRELLSHDYSEI